MTTKCNNTRLIAGMSLSKKAQNVPNTYKIFRNQKKSRFFSINMLKFNCTGRVEATIMSVLDYGNILYGHLCPTDVMNIGFYLFLKLSLVFYHLILILQYLLIQVNIILAQSTGPLCRFLQFLLTSESPVFLTAQLKLSTLLSIDPLSFIYIKYLITSYFTSSSSYF